MKYFFFTIVLLILTTTAVMACGCNDIFGKDKSTLVFNGTVLKITQVGNTSEYAVVLKITRVIKGKVAHKKITIYTPCLEQGCCGFPFEEKKRYYVVTRVIRGELVSDACTTTTML